VKNSHGCFILYPQPRTDGVLSDILRHSRRYNAAERNGFANLARPRILRQIKTASWEIKSVRSPVCDRYAAKVAGTMAACTGYHSAALTALAASSLRRH
jgi:hypothetical protein